MRLQLSVTAVPVRAHMSYFPVLCQLYGLAVPTTKAMLDGHSRALILWPSCGLACGERALTV